MDIVAQEQEGESLTRLVRELTAARAKAASARHHLQVCNQLCSAPAGCFSVILQSKHCDREWDRHDRTIAKYTVTLETRGTAFQMSVAGR